MKRAKVLKFQHAVRSRSASKHIFWWREMVWRVHKPGLVEYKGVVPVVCGVAWSTRRGQVTRHGHGHPVDTTLRSWSTLAPESHSQHRALSLKPNETSSTTKNFNGSRSFSKRTLLSLEIMWGMLCGKWNTRSLKLLEIFTFFWN